MAGHCTGPIVHPVARGQPQADSSCGRPEPTTPGRSEEHTSELQSRVDLVCRLLLEKKKETAQAGLGCNDGLQAGIKKNQFAWNRSGEGYEHGLNKKRKGLHDRDRITRKAKAILSMR